MLEKCVIKRPKIDTIKNLPTEIKRQLLIYNEANDHINYFKNLKHSGHLCEH